MGRRSIKVKKGRENVVERHLKRMMDGALLEAENPYSFGGFWFDRDALVIAANLTGCEYLDLNFVERAIFRAAWTCAKEGCAEEGVTDLRKFADLVSRFLEEAERKPKSAFTAVFAIDTKEVPSWFLPRRVLGLEIRSSTWEDVSDLVGGVPVESLWQWHDAPISEYELHQFQPVIVCSEGVSDEDAFDAALEAVSLVRACYNCVANAHVRTIRFGGPEPLAHLRSGPAYAIVDSSGIRQAFFEADATRYRRDPINGKYEKLYVDLIARFEETPAPRSSAARLGRALAVYTDAVDHRYDQEHFLGLWQCLDILSNPPGGKTDELASRVSNLWTDAAEAKPILEALAPLRNRLVHEGHFGKHCQVAVRMLHEMATLGMLQFNAFIDDLPMDADFETYFALCSRPGADLERTSKVVNFVEGIRARTAAR